MRVLHLLKAYRVRLAYRRKRKLKIRKLAEDRKIISRIYVKIDEVRQEYLKHQRENPYDSKNGVYHSKITLLEDLLK